MKFHAFVSMKEFLESNTATEFNVEDLKVDIGSIELHTKMTFKAEDISKRLTEIASKEGYKLHSYNVSKGHKEIGFVCEVERR